jgi:tRNA-(ms[2]io[6]A)-hydroxylase
MSARADAVSAFRRDPASLAPLLVETPAAWLEVACERWRELLVDHGNCEKKAASTALSLLFTYPEDVALTLQLSRLAREELRHFEQVQRLMVALEVPFMRLSPSRYAEGLRRAVRAEEPGRRIDLLVCGALIEARSCERFRALAPRLAEPLSSFYRTLSKSEARHFRLYLDLAEEAARLSAADLATRIEQLAAVEAELIMSPDPTFRFHSGVPAPQS